MYNFHYNFRSENLTLDYYLQTQTVYVTNFIKKNTYKKMYKYKEVFDLSNFPVSSKEPDDVNTFYKKLRSF